MKILIIRFSALGDVAMVAPVVKQMAMEHPEVDITVLSKPFCEVLFSSLAPNVHFLGADIKGEYHGINGLGRLFRKLHAMQFTHIADFHGVLRTHYLCLRFRMSGYHVVQIDKERRSRKQLTAPEGKKHLVQLATSYDKYWRVIEKLGLRRNSQSYPFERVIDYSAMASSLSFPEIPEAETLRHPTTINIGIAPFAAHGGKQYPKEKMEEVIRLLLMRNAQCRIYLFGGSEEVERSTMMEWEERWQGSVVAASPRLRSIGKELQLMSQLGSMITMDSANMHLASLVGTRVVSVWGATHPCAGFLGWRQRESDCVQTDLPCRPCSIFGSKPCQRGDFACMNGISPEMIVERVFSEDKGQKG